MKTKPQYKIGDYVEFEALDSIASKTKHKGFIQDGWFGVVVTCYVVKNRKNKLFYVNEKDIIRKLPINRDKNGRFVSKVKVTKVDIKEIKFQVNDEKKDCACYNCPKCEAEMREHYKKTGDLNTYGNAPIGSTYDPNTDITKPYDEFGSRPKVEEKKPSERIQEIYTEIRSNWNSPSMTWCRSIERYLDEQFEKAK